MTVTSFFTTCAIGLAGAFGAISRYLMGLMVAQRTRFRFPLGTFLINILGAFLIGLIASLTTQKILLSNTQAILATGFLGGFTTFSTMNWEGISLLRVGRTRLSFFYLFGSVIVGLVAVGLGLLLGQVLGGLL